MNEGCKGCKAVRDFLSKLKGTYGLFSKEENSPEHSEYNVEDTQTKLQELIDKAKRNG